MHLRFWMAAAATLWCLLAGFGSSPPSALADADSLDVWADQSYEPSSYVEGRLEVYRIRSRTLGDERRLFVLLPPTYGQLPQKRYPVIYGLDGQDLFDDKIASGGHEWAVDELLSRRPEGVREAFIVGIESGAHMVSDYSPPGVQPKARGDRFLVFLLDEVKAFVDKQYRTLPDKANTIVMGQGPGAVFAVYAAWTASHKLFGAIAMEFPDLNEESLGFLEEAPIANYPWIWLEQKAAEKARPSNATLLSQLQKGADVRFVVTGMNTTRPRRILTAFRAIPFARAP